MVEGSGDKWRMMESEMNRFEEEISSLGGPGPGQGGNFRRAFIPSQVARKVPPPPPPHLSSAKMNTVIISGAPQVYVSPANQAANSTSNSNAATAAGNSNKTNNEISTNSASRVNYVPNQKFIPSSQNVIGPSIVPATNSTSTAAATASSSSTSLNNSNTEPSKAVAGSSSNPTGGGTNMEKSKKGKKKKKSKKQQEHKPKKFLRAAGGTVWEDTTLLDWDPAGFRLFCGDLGNDVTDEVLTRVFGRYPSFQRAKVIRDKRTNKTKGYGFVSFKDPNDFVRAIKELDGRYVGSRPIKLRKSAWKNRNIDQVKKREKERNQLVGIIGPKKPGK